MIKVEGNKITTKGSNADIIAEAIGVYTQIFSETLIEGDVRLVTSMLLTTMEELTDALRSVRENFGSADHAQGN